MENVTHPAVSRSTKVGFLTKFVVAMIGTEMLRYYSVAGMIELPLMEYILWWMTAQSRLANGYVYPQLFFIQQFA